MKKPSQVFQPGQFYLVLTVVQYDNFNALPDSLNYGDDTAQPDWRRGDEIPMIIPVGSADYLLDRYAEEGVGPYVDNLIATANERLQGMCDRQHMYRGADWEILPSEAAQKMVKDRLAVV